QALHAKYGDQLFDVDQSCLVLLLGTNPRRGEQEANGNTIEAASGTRIDQTALFTQTLSDLLENRGFRRGRAKLARWLDPSVIEDKEEFFKSQAWNDLLKSADLVVLVEDSPYWSESMIREQAAQVVDSRQHRFALNPKTRYANHQTAIERRLAGESLDVTATYTGIVPIVYKAQRALLTSLIQSIMLSFGMISVVMMLLLRNWQMPWTWRNSLNMPAALVVMLPNVFPIVLIFGAMGYWGISVDIGSMMTASVAMGIAVDDTIHFLNWYRHGLQDGHSRHAAIRQAYRRCGMAMTQTTMIAGLGLSVFALSTFAPTQRFGVLMLVLLMAALIGDLILLPAILASPLGKLFGTTAKVSTLHSVKPTDDQAAGEAAGESGVQDIVSLRVVKPDDDPADGVLDKPPPSTSESIRRSRKG
ncbi:MAG TPA: MMPL family transporter, partial [Pirellulaceae bacterium]|nr:MMPL family transporter [Pirellulaceae bacterium]